MILQAFYRLLNCIFFAIVFVTLSGSIFTSQAQKVINEKDLKVTEKEKAVLGFFRLAGVAPDYESWIMETYRYKSIEDQKDKVNFLIEESLRLGYGYSSFNPSKSLLEFNTNVITSYTPSSGKSPPQLHFKFPNQNADYIPVFEYPYGKNSIALVLNGFANFSQISLTDEQYKKVLRIMPFQDEEYTAKLFIQVRLVRADIERPIINQNTYQWMMLGEVEYMRCQILDPTNMGQTKLWEYVSPWYKNNFMKKDISPEETAPHPYELFKDKNRR